jgi:hypothetical protein
MLISEGNEKIVVETVPAQDMVSECFSFKRDLTLALDEKNRGA